MLELCVTVYLQQRSTVPPHLVVDTPRVGVPEYVVQSQDGRRVQIPNADMFVLRELNPLDPYGRGLGQAEAVADEIEPFGVCPMIARDAITGERIGVPAVYRDGDYSWRTETIYYFEKYNLALPDDFVAHVLSKIKQ